MKKSNLISSLVAFTIGLATMLVITKLAPNFNPSRLVRDLSAELFPKQTYVLVDIWEGKYWQVDLSGHQEFDKEIESTVERFEAQMRASGKEMGLVDLKRPQFPSFLKKLQKISIMTKSGIKQLSLRGIAYLSRGCSVRFAFELVGVPTRESFAIGSLNAPFPRNAYLRDLQTSSGKDHGAVADKIWKGILATADKDLLMILKAKKNKMDASRLLFAKTKLSDKDAWIVWLREGIVTLMDKGDYELGFSAIVDAKGNILHKLSDVTTNISGWEPLFVTDLNGDGKEEIIGSDYYHEGSSRVILEFKDKGYKTTTLTSEGC